MPPHAYPDPIRAGDTLALVAPASSPSRQAVEAAIASLKARGYHVKQYRPLDVPVGFLSGDDQARADELMRAFLDPEVSAVIAVRGGYGVARLLPLLNFDAIRAHPKVLAGYSDITALHVALDHHAALITYHSPNAVDGLGGDGALEHGACESFWRGVANSNRQYELPGSYAPWSPRVIASGVGEGRLIGGNLAVLCGLIGTPFEPDTAGRVLFLEDIGEQPYRVDRMLRQLQLAGKLDNLAGVLLGHFTDCQAPRDAASQSLEEVLDDYFANLGAPVLANFPAGHQQPNLTLPHGARVRLDADDPKISVLE